MDDIPLPPDTWRDRAAAVRDRILVHPRFLRLASKLPIVRWVARRRARDLFDLCAGFVYSQVLFACVRLRLLESLAERPRTASEVASAHNLPVSAAQRLLRAAVALRLAEKRSGDRYGLGPLGAALLGNPGVAAMVEHHALLYADLADPVALLRGQHSGSAMKQYWSYVDADSIADLGNREVSSYSELMSASQAFVAEQILDAYPLDRHRRLLDVGGGEGTFLEIVGDRTSDLELVLFDLPPVAERARSRLEAGRLAARSTIVGGDFRADPLPRGADVITLVRVVHDHDDEVALDLLRAARDALAPGGVLLLAEPMSGTAGAEAVGDAYFGFYLLAMGSGRPRHPEELESMLHDAGFRDVRRVPTRMPLLTRLLAARP